MAAVFKRDNGITVSYPTREAEQNISAADYYAVRLIGETKKVCAIKFVRMQTGLGLYESKQIVDTILMHRDVTNDDMGQQTSLGGLLRAKLDAERHWPA